MYYDTTKGIELERYPDLPDGPLPMPEGLVTNPDGGMIAKFWLRKGIMPISDIVQPVPWIVVTAWNYVMLPDDTVRKEPLTTLTQKEYDAQQAVEMAAVEQAAQQAYLLDIQQHAAQYTLENCYRMLLDQLRGDESHEAMSGEEYATRMAALMMSDPVKFQKMFVAFSFVQSQLLHDLGETWADRAQWRDVPALVTAAQERLAMLG